jgi:alpha-ketoglutarate-dependent taurine dioxygenase
MQRVQTEQQQLQRLQAHNAYLNRQANYYKDPFVIESEAREQLGYIRPGEHPVIITGVTNSGQPATHHSTTSPVQQGYWQEWWNIFFGI